MRSYNTLARARQRRHMRLNFPPSWLNFLAHLTLRRAVRRSGVARSVRGLLDSNNRRSLNHAPATVRVVCTTTTNPVEIIRDRSGTLSPWLGKLTSLKQLLLDHNQLSGRLPKTAGDLRDLEVQCTYQHLTKRDVSPRGGLEPNKRTFKAGIHGVLGGNFLH